MVVEVLYAMEVEGTVLVLKAVLVEETVTVLVPGYLVVVTVLVET